MASQENDSPSGFRVPLNILNVQTPKSHSRRSKSKYPKSRDASSVEMPILQRGDKAATTITGYHRHVGRDQNPKCHAIYFWSFENRIPNSLGTLVKNPQNLMKQTLNAATCFVAIRGLICLISSTKSSKSNSPSPFTSTYSISTRKSCKDGPTDAARYPGHPPRPYRLMTSMAMANRYRYRNRYIYIILCYNVTCLGKIQLLSS